MKWVLGGLETGAVGQRLFILLPPEFWKWSNFTQSIFAKKNYFRQKVLFLPKQNYFCQKKIIFVKQSYLRQKILFLRKKILQKNLFSPKNVIFAKEYYFAKKCYFRQNYIFWMFEFYVILAARILPYCKIVCHIFYYISLFENFRYFRTFRQIPHNFRPFS